jgi:cytosolic carboxypeptidase protein 5
MTGIIEELS